MKRFYITVVFLIIIFGTIFQCLTMFRSGMMYDFGIGYWGPTARDGVWHQALVGQLMNALPPENPGFAGNILTNYHYSYDLLVSITARVTSLDPTDLIYRFFPLVFSLLFGIGTYLLSNLIFKNKLTNLLVLFFAYFGSSFGWIIEFLRDGSLGGESAFWINQPVSMNLNPPFAISMILMIIILILLINFRSDKNRKQSLLLIILISTLSGFKIYAGIVVLLSLGIICFYERIAFKRKDLLLVFFLSVFFTLILFFLQNGEFGGLVVFKPFWFINSMIDAPDRVGWIKLSSARDAYFSSKNWVKYFLTQSLGFAIYVVGNFGTRIIGILSLAFISRKFFLERKYYLPAVMLMVSFAIPLFFIQKGNPWNTIQFSYYSLYMLSIFAGFSLSTLTKKMPLVLACFVILVILLVTPISSYTTFTFAYTNNPPAKLSTGEYQALSYLRGLEPGVVLAPVFDKNLRSRYVNPFPLAVYDTTSYISAFSGKAVYIEDEEQQKILGKNYLPRVSDVNKFFSATDASWSKEFLKQNNIKYVYTPKLYGFSEDVYGHPLIKLFENEEACVFKVAD